MNEQEKNVQNLEKQAENVTMNATLNTNLPGAKSKSLSTGSENTPGAKDGKQAGNKNLEHSTKTLRSVVKAPVVKKPQIKVQFNSQSKTFLAGGFTIFFVFLLVLGAIRPTITDIVRIRNQLKVYKDIATKLDTKIDTIYELKSTFDRNQRTLALFDIYYPSNFDYSLFVANLEYIAKDIGSKLVSVSYSAQVGEAYAKEFGERGVHAVVPVVFTVTIEGDYNQLVSFLKRLEETPFLPEVLSMNYRASTPTKKQTFSINILLFKLKAPIIRSDKDIYEQLTTGLQ